MEKEKKLREITERLVQMAHETSPYTKMLERKKRREAEQKIEAERLEAERQAKIEKEKKEKADKRAKEI